MAWGSCHCSAGVKSQRCAIGVRREIIVRSVMLFGASTRGIALGACSAATPRSCFTCGATGPRRRPPPPPEAIHHDAPPRLGKPRHDPHRRPPRDLPPGPGNHLPGRLGRRRHHPLWRRLRDPPSPPGDRLPGRLGRRCGPPSLPGDHLPGRLGRCRHQPPPWRSLREPPLQPGRPGRRRHHPPWRPSPRPAAPARQPPDRPGSRRHHPAWRPSPRPATRPASTRPRSPHTSSLKHHPRDLRRGGRTRPRLRPHERLARILPSRLRRMLRLGGVRPRQIQPSRGAGLPAQHGGCTSTGFAVNRNPLARCPTRRHRNILDHPAVVLDRANRARRRGARSSATARPCSRVGRVWRLRVGPS